MRYFMNQAKKSSLTWIVILISGLRIITEGSCILNYIQSIRLYLVQKLYEEKGKTCSSLKYKGLMIGLICLYFSLAFTALYFHGYLYYIILLSISIFVLFSGYFIPGLLKISQVNLAAGLSPLFKPRITFGPEDMDVSDLSLDREDIEKESESAKVPLEEDYFSEFQNKMRKSAQGEVEGKSRKKKSKPRRYLNLIVPYFSLIASICCLAIILTKLYNQVKLLF